MQIVAALTIPLIFVGLLVSRTMRRSSFRWKQATMATLMSLVPLVFILAMQGIQTTMLAAGSILLAVLLVLFMGSGKD